MYQHIFFRRAIRFILALGLTPIAHFSSAQVVHGADSLKHIDLPTASVVRSNPDRNTKEGISRKMLDVLQSRTLGETLSQIPGVQNVSFGPNSGAPMIRSLSGNRVKVLSNGLPANDLSGISPNLNISTDMDNMTGIDVYKTNASVLYGGKAIGGAINMRDNTIPVELPLKRFYGMVKAEGGTNNGVQQALELNGQFGKNWVWHLGGTNHSNKDIKIPGNTKSPLAYDTKIDPLTAAMAQVFVDSESIQNVSLYPYISQYVVEQLKNPNSDLSESDKYTFSPTSTIGTQIVNNPVNDKYVPGQDPGTPFYTIVVHDIRDYAPVQKGVMPNSHAENQGVNIGTSYIGENYYIGAGFVGFSGYYGIPGFAMTSKLVHTHEAVAQHIEYTPINTRTWSNALLFESALKPNASIISSLKLNYQFRSGDDRELVGIYRVNDFYSTRHSVRLELEQRNWRFLKGITGVDLSSLKIDGEGETRFLPDNQSRELGVFTVQQIAYGPMHANIGYRHDRVERRAWMDETYVKSRGLAGGNLSPCNFNLNHFNADVQLNVWKYAFLRAAFVHAERAPDVNELYAGNDHFAIMTEENGDDRLLKEISNTYELGGGFSYQGIQLKATHYHTDFNNYLYMAHTGLSRAGGFIVKEWRASDTEITGWETELNYQSVWGKDRTWRIGSFFDLVKNRNTSDDELRKWAEGDFMPNMPTSRYNISGEVSTPKIDAYLAFDRYLKQRYLGKKINLEPAMPPYSLMNARLAYKSNIKTLGVEYYVYGNNLLNVEARPQNSYLKYLAPLPGRNFAVGVKAML